MVCLKHARTDAGLATCLDAQHASDALGRDAQISLACAVVSRQ